MDLSNYMIDFLGVSPTTPEQMDDAAVSKFFKPYIKKEVWIIKR